MKLVIVISLFFAGNLVFTSCENFNPSMKLSIYYETLCPDSIRFFRYQFNKTYEEFLPYVDFDFIPYGHARHRWENGKWNIQCQHGQKECVGNRFHACALAQGNGREKDVKFISCSMSATNPTSYLKLIECAEKTNISFEAIENCFRNGQGHELLVKYGERTAALTPKLSYVPTIVFDDVYDDEIQNNAEKRLRKTICDYIKPKPAVCGN